MNHDPRLRPLPELPAGAEPRPLSCSGPGNHTAMGFRCANTGIDGYLGYVCSRCASEAGRAPHKPYCETCNVCAIAEKNGSSMAKALAAIEELHLPSLKRGKAVCASTDKTAKPCRKCIRKVCQHCENPFRSHNNRTAHCSDICKAAARRETHRRHNEQRREQQFSAAV